MTTSYPAASIYQNAEKEQRQRIALIIGRTLLITGVLISFTVLYIAVSLKGWNLFVLYGGNLLYLALTYLGLRQIQKQNPTVGVLLVSGAVPLTIALLPLMFSDIGNLVGLFSILVTSLIASQTLEPIVVRKVVPFNALAGVLIILLGYLPFPFRTNIPGTLVITVGILAILETLALIVIVWRQFGTFDIKTKLIMAFVTLLVVSLLVIGAYNLLGSYRIQRTQASASLESDLLLKRTAIMDFLEAARRDVIYLGDAEVLHTYNKALGDLAAPNVITRTRVTMEREFRRFAEGRGIYQRIRYLNNDGNEIVRIDTDSNGVSSIIPQTELLDADEFDSPGEILVFSQVRLLNTGEVYESPLGLKREGGQIEIPHEPIIQIGTPLVINTQHKGAVVANIYADEFLGILSASGADTFLVDPDGYYLYHPEEARRWGRDLNTTITIGNDFPGLMDSLYSGEVGGLETDGYLIAYAPVSIPGDTSPRWYIGAFIPIDVISRPIFTSAYNALTILLLTIIVSIFIMVYLGNTITSPIGNLAAVAQDVAAGKLTTRARVETNDEVGILAGIFNTMTSQLQESFTGLETRVAERTAELAKEKHQSDVRARQFEAITRVARVINVTKNLQDLLPQISQVISEQFGFYHVGIFLNDSASQMAILSAANSEGGKRMLQRNHQLRIGEQGMVGYVAKTGTPRIALDVGTDAIYFDNPDLPETHSEMALPLKAGDTIIGALDIQSTEAGAFTDEDFEALSALADQVSLAIQNARLFEQTGKALAEAKAIQHQYIRETWSRISSEEKIKGYRYTLAGVSPLSDETTSADSPDNRVLRVPIDLRGEVIGTLSVQIPKDGKLSSDQIDLIRAVAERVALSAENARLFEETASRAMREHLVSDITTKIRGTNDPQEMIQTAVQELKRALGVSRVEIIPRKNAPSPDK